MPTCAHHGESVVGTERGWCPGRQGRVDVKLPDCDDEAVPMPGGGLWPQEGMRCRGAESATSPTDSDGSGTARTHVRTHAETEPAKGQRLRTRRATRAKGKGLERRAKRTGRRLLCALKSHQNGNPNTDGKLDLSGRRHLEPREGGGKASWKRKGLFCCTLCAVKLCDMCAQERNESDKEQKTHREKGSWTGAAPSGHGTFPEPLPQPQERGCTAPASQAGRASTSIHGPHAPPAGHAGHCPQRRPAFSVTASSWDHGHLCPPRSSSIRQSARLPAAPRMRWKNGSMELARGTPAGLDSEHGPQSPAAPRGAWRHCPGPCWPPPPPAHTTASPTPCRPAGPRETVHGQPPQAGLSHRPWSL